MNEKSLEARYSFRIRLFETVKFSVVNPVARRQIRPLRLVASEKFEIVLLLTVTLPGIVPRCMKRKPRPL